MMFPEENVLISPVRNFSLRYGCGELAWYLNPNPTMEQIVHYAPSYTKFAEDNYAFYGARIHTQLMTVAQRLRVDPSCRRGVISVWHPEDLKLARRKDLPCTISWKFNVCDFKLNMIADMRSNDAWLGMPNDIFVNTCIHILMSKLTGYKLGWYQHQVADMHLYQQDFNKAAKALGNRIASMSVPLGKDIKWSDVMDIVSYEDDIRHGLGVPAHKDSFINFVLEKLK